MVKKYIRIFVFLTIICALLFSFYSFNILKISNVTLIQIGAFTKEINAQRMSERLGGRVIKDGSKYRVYYAILQDEKNISYITDYLEENNIEYYLKKTYISNLYIKRGEVYENLMKECKNNTVKLKIKDELLYKYGEKL